MRIITTCMALALVLALAGCVINVPLVPPPAPMEEQVIEGKGNNKIALLDITGFISAEPRTEAMGPDTPSMPSDLREALSLAAIDDDVRGVVIRINSPGGSAAASDMLYHELSEFRQQSEKPVYAVITGMGTSGAYYAASAADRIWAHPSAVTGSIGVLAVNVEASGLMEKLGVRSKVVKSGSKKDMFSPIRPDTPEEKAIMQGLIDSMHERFLDVVEEGRNGKLTRKRIEDLADGRPYTAEQALEVGLIDNVGYLDEAINALKKDLGVKRAQVVAYLRPGQYRSTIHAAPPGGVNINVLNIGPGVLGLRPGVQFLYLWQPGL